MNIIFKLALIPIIIESFVFAAKGDIGNTIAVCFCGLFVLLLNIIRIMEIKNK